MTKLSIYNNLEVVEAAGVEPASESLPGEGKRRDEVYRLADF